MPVIAREVTEIPAGRYNGTIVSSLVEKSRNKTTGEEYDYLNLRIDTGKPIGNWDGVFRASCPANLSSQTMFGRLLQRLGIQFVVKQEFDERVLEGLKVKFDAVRKDNLTNVVFDTITKA